MKHNLPSGRRDFLKAAGLSSMAMLMPGFGTNSYGAPLPRPDAPGFGRFSLVNFSGDGLNYTPEEYLETLLTMNKENPIQADYYSMGGVTAGLEAEFAKLTGKEKAVFLPTGTMANEVAIKLLAGDRAKIVVPENSHIYRDEADAAFVVHHKRLVPAGEGKSYFDAEELDRVIGYHRQGEVFPSDVGAVAVECPVRRADGTAVPLEVLKGISAYCRDKGYGLHLDGARLHLASAWTGIPIAEYSSFFDTVYISQYKYLNAAFGAVLCGPADIIDRMPVQAKLHGGAVFQTWPAAAMAFHHLQTIADDLARAKKAGEELIGRLNAIDGVMITPVPSGTNVYTLDVADTIDPAKLARVLMEHHNIQLRVPEGGTPIALKINASLLRRTLAETEGAWTEAVGEARR